MVYLPPRLWHRRPTLQAVLIPRRVVCDRNRPAAGASPPAAYSVTEDVIDPVHRPLTGFDADHQERLHTGQWEHQ